MAVGVDHPRLREQEIKTYGEILPPSRSLGTVINRQKQSL